MSHIIIVLFDLKKNRKITDYEDWANSTDLPIVRQLKSIDSFDVLRCTGVLGSTDAAPFQYAEVLKINDFDQFEADVSTELMQSVANQFQSFADDPIFITTESIEPPVDNVI